MSTVLRSPRSFYQTSWSEDTAWRRGRSCDLSRQMFFYLDGFEEVQVVEEVLLCMVQPDARGPTEDILYQQRYLLV